MADIDSDRIKDAGIKCIDIFSEMELDIAEIFMVISQLQGAMLGNVFNGIFQSLEGDYDDDEESDDSEEVETEKEDLSTHTLDEVMSDLMQNIIKRKPENNV